MRIRLRDYLTSLDIKDFEDLENCILSILNKLGYSPGDVELNPVLNHPLLKDISVDYAVLKHKNKYGIIINVGNIDRESEAELCGICTLIGALYGVLTDGEEIVVIKPKSGVEWEYLDYIPSKDELEEELGIRDYTVISIKYDEYEKLDDINLLIDNSKYVFLDTNRDQIVIVQPNRKLIRELRFRGISFKSLNDVEVLESILDFVNL